MAEQMQTPKIDARAAVRAAANYLQSIQDLIPAENLRLEEVEISEDKNFWLITLGFNEPKKKPKNANNPSLGNNPLLGIAGIATSETRQYKIFRVNSHTGEVEAMKIRSL